MTELWKLEDLLPDGLKELIQRYNINKIDRNAPRCDATESIFKPCLYTTQSTPEFSGIIIPLCNFNPTNKKKDDIILCIDATHLGLLVIKRSGDLFVDPNGNTFSLTSHIFSKCTTSEDAFSIDSHLQFTLALFSLLLQILKKKLMFFIKVLLVNSEYRAKVFQILIKLLLETEKRYKIMSRNTIHACMKIHRKSEKIEAKNYKTSASEMYWKEKNYLKWDIPSSNIEIGDKKRQTGNGIITYQRSSDNDSNQITTLSAIWSKEEEKQRSMKYLSEIIQDLMQNEPNVLSLTKSQLELKHIHVDILFKSIQPAEKIGAEIRIQQV